MNDALISLLGNIKAMREEVKQYKNQMNDWKKNEHNVALKERNEQQANAKRVEEEVKRAFSLQDMDNFRLKQQIENLTFDKTHMQQHFVDLEKKFKDLEFTIGQEDAPDLKPEIEPDEEQPEQA